MTTSQPSSSHSLITLEFNSDLTRVADAVSRVVSILPPQFLHLQTQLELALTEGLNNAVVHGNSLMPDSQVSITVFGSADSIEIQIEDEGRKLQAGDLIEAKMPESGATSGRGLALIHSLAPASEISDGKLCIRWYL